MLQWTGGSRRKVATSRKSTHCRQKQYFEQRKRQRQAYGQENCSNRSDKQVFCNAESRSLDILNLINLAVASQPASTELPASVDSHVTKISEDSLLGKVMGKATGGCSTVVETRLEDVTNSSDSILPQVCQTTYKSVGQGNICKMPGSVPEYTSSWMDDTFNERKEKTQIEATVLDLLGDDGPYSYGRSSPETHVALSVDGLGKIGSQTPAQSPRMQNRFSCKGFSMASKTSRQNDMIGDFRVSPLCSKGGTWAYNGAKTTCKSAVAPASSYSHEDQVEEISTKGKWFDACLLAPNEKHRNDSFGYLENQFIEESYDTAPDNRRFSFVGYPFLNSSTKKFEKYAASDEAVRDTFLGSSRNLWEGDESFEASATSTPHFKHLTSEKEGDPLFLWESDGTTADGMFKPPIWSFLSTEDSQDSINILSEDLNSSTAVRKKNSLNFGTHSMRLGENKRNSSDKFQLYSEERNFMRTFSQGENIFTGLDDATWGKKQSSSSSAFEKLDDDHIFSPGQVFPSDPFNSFTMKTASTSGYEAMFQDDHLDLFSMPKSNFKHISESELTNNFISQNEILRKKTDFELNSIKPMKSQTKDKSFGQYSSSGGELFNEIFLTHLPKYQEYNEDRGSSGKPQPKDYEKRSTSSGNAESVAGVETLSKITEHEESKSKIADPCDSHRVENSNEKIEVIPTVVEELPTQIQNYVHSKLNQFQGHTPVPSHPSKEESIETSEPEIKEVHSECGGNNDASYQVMLQSYVLQLLCVQKVLLEASGKDIKKV